MAALTPFDPAKVEKLHRALTDALTISEILAVHNQAQALMRRCRGRSLDLPARNSIAEIVLRAERKGGRLLAKLHLRGGNRKVHDFAGSQKLIDWGIDRNISARWQKTAGVPELTFEAYIRWANRGKTRISRAGLLGFARKSTTRRRRRLAGLPGERQERDSDELRSDLDVLSNVVESVADHESTTSKARELTFLKHKFGEFAEKLTRMLNRRDRSD